jgi:hypothetical protein
MRKIGFWGLPKQNKPLLPVQRSLQRIGWLADRWSFARHFEIVLDSDRVNQVGFRGDRLMHGAKLHPVVKLPTQTGIRVAKRAMAEVENQIQGLT